ncbi:DUF2812 domain-containing protein [Faecalibacterium sp. CLA-AA-H254]|uniref:DUF2812 domain-containing protein n=1 Tax=Faecalibacterium hominis (ex Afrizal et al. 2022) TaxID=2881265 RepID=UPI001D0DF846|nr:DUF2812 domain-containing protein [Faecalibacterium hominis (ex Afrizal et al. 2022)]MCC2121869.1 DUF2812 domain-containing protein [Faecalibacterium hominis (ex Afrizal et al. 2022)]
MSETKTLHRNFWVWEFEKEERWLNEMAQEGWALQNAGFCTYTFEKTEPGQYIIRLAMLDSSPDFESFMEELEAQSVGHCFSWGYFRRSAQLGPFDMFSDVDSRISHLNKIGQMVRLLCLANLLIGVTNTFSGASLAWLNLLCATFLAYGLGRIRGNRTPWKKSAHSTSDYFPFRTSFFQSFQKVHVYPLAFRCRRVYYCHKQIVIMC